MAKKHFIAIDVEEVDAMDRIDYSLNDLVIGEDGQSCERMSFMADTSLSGIDPAKLIEELEDLLISNLELQND